MNVPGARRAVAEEGKADRRMAEPPLRIGAAHDIGEHDAQVRDHGETSIARVAVMDIPFPCLGRATAVGDVLAEMITKMSAPNEVSAKTTVRKGDHVDCFVGEESQWNNQCLIALTSGYGASDQALAEKIEDAVVARASELHPAVGEKKTLGLTQFGKPDMTAFEQIGRRRETHWVEKVPAGGRGFQKKLQVGAIKSGLEYGPDGQAGPPRSHGWATNCLAAVTSAGVSPCPAVDEFKVTVAPAPRNCSARRVG